MKSHHKAALKQFFPKTTVPLAYESTLPKLPNSINKHFKKSSNVKGSAQIETLTKSMLENHSLDTTSVEIFE